MNTYDQSNNILSVEDTYHICLSSLRLLVSDDGYFLASSRDEAYGCIFGRDTAITALLLLESNLTPRDLHDFLPTIKQSLQNLLDLRGKTLNIESGEEPGKIIHEYRESKYERLVQREHPWFLYPDKKIRSYDTLDATPLTLIALYRYMTVCKDSEFIEKNQKSIYELLLWMHISGDSNQDSLLEYRFHASRSFGGLHVQSWTDSLATLMPKNGTLPPYPIAPIEVQAFAWLAYRMWADYFASRSGKTSKFLRSQADQMKRVFTTKYRFHEQVEQEQSSFAQAIDGNGSQIKTITANPLFCLWSRYTNPVDGTNECIVDDVYAGDILSRTFQPDMFHEAAGFRTMSSASSLYDPSPHSYHNGSFWPMLNAIGFAATQKYGTQEQLERIFSASFLPIRTFGFPLELYTVNENGVYTEYISRTSKRGCRYQAWSAAAAVYMYSWMNAGTPLRSS